MGSRHWQPSHLRHLLLAGAILQYSRPVSGFFWLKATTLPGNFDLDIDEYLTAAQILEPITLASWQHCVDIDDSTSYRSFGEQDLLQSRCSFGADHSNDPNVNAWTIYATSNPTKIDISNSDYYTTRKQAEIYLPKIEQTLAKGNSRSYLTMGSGEPGVSADDSVPVRWKAYRPVEQRALRGAARRRVVVAHGQDPTFAALRPLESGETVVAKTLPLGDSGFSRYIGDFPVTEVTGKSDNALQQGDFLAIEGGQKHIQEVYVGAKPALNSDVIGCTEIVFRVYKDMSPPVDQGEFDTPEQDFLVNKMVYKDTEYGNTNMHIPFEDTNTGSTAPASYFTSLLSSGRGPESETASVPASNEMQQGNKGGLPGITRMEQEAQYNFGRLPGGAINEDYTDIPQQGQASDYPRDLDYFGLNAEHQRPFGPARLPADFFEADHTDYQQANIPDLAGEIEDLVDQLEPEVPGTEGADGDMLIEQEAHEDAIWGDQFPDNPFRDLGDPEDYSARIDDEGDMRRWAQFGRILAGSQLQDDDSSNFANNVDESSRGMVSWGEQTIQEQEERPWYIFPDFRGREVDIY
ncbi:hypothetical protein TWF281_007695 [Arthrobotrys megalospora]